jgi:hypothetical protein
MPFTESLARSGSPSRCPQNESTATAESLRGTGLTVKRFNRGAVRWCSGAAVRGLGRP